MTIWTEGSWTETGEPVLPKELPEFMFLFKLTRHSDGSDRFWHYLTTCDDRGLRTLLVTFAAYAQGRNSALPRWFWSPILSPTCLPPDTSNVVP